MRAISSDILTKLKKRLQAASTSAAPTMRIISEQASVNALLAETIHTGADTSRGDVSVRHRAGMDSPDYAFAICLDGGYANIYGRKLPAEYAFTWQFLFQFGQASDVAIEFDGEWKLNTSRDYYNLITEVSPWIFWIDSGGTLYAQHWQDESTRAQLDTGVAEVSAVRGWQSTITPTDDQGLVVAYRKGAEVYYRAYCTTTSGTKAWEGAQQISELSGAQSVGVFRTNDYRIGFISETSAGIKYVISERQYAGGSFPSEYFWAGTVGVSGASVTPVVTKTQNIAAESFTASPAALVGFYAQVLDTSESIAQPVVTSCVRTGLRDFVLTMDKPLTFEDGGIDIAEYFSAPSDIKTVEILSDGRLHATTSSDHATNLAVNFTAACPWISFIYNGKRCLLNTTLTAPAVVDTYNETHAETFTAQPVSVTNASLITVTTSYYSVNPNDVFTAQPVSVTSASIIPVGAIPV